MGSEQGIERWYARWMVVVGRAACTGCLESQALEDCESPFSYAPTCEASDEQVKHPWTALHDILDRARG